MNAKGLVFVVFCFILSICVIVYGLTSGSNNLKFLFQVIFVCSGLLGFLRPIFGMYLLVILTGYTDLLKRFMAFDLTMAFDDLYWVLGAPVVLVAAIFLRLLLDSITSKSFESVLKDLFVSALCIIGVFGYSIITKDASISALAKAAAGASYCLFIFIIPRVFTDWKHVVKYLKFSILCYIPVALYAIWQSIYGLNDFEMDYLLSGFTIEQRQLSRSVFRYYSTLSSAHALSIIMSMFVCMAIVIGIKFKFSNHKVVNAFIAVIVIIFFVYAASVTLTRSGWLCGIACLFCWVSFRYKLSTVFIYLLGLTILCLFFTMPTTVYELLDGGMIYNSDSDFETLAFQTSTWKERLDGYVTLKEDSTYLQPFGLYAAGMGDLLDVGRGEYGFSHDAVTSFIMSVGYIPSLFCIIVGFIVVKKLHGQLFHAKGTPNYELLLFSVAFVFGVLANGLTSENLFALYPVNVFLWLFLSVGVWLLRYQNEPNVKEYENIDKPY